MGKDEYGFEEDNLYEEEEIPEEEIKIEETVSEGFNKKNPGEIKEKIRDGKIIDALKKIKDPEIDIDIWNLGLIYDMDLNENKLEIKMTFTSPTCPFGPQIVNSIKTEITKLGYDEPEVELVFNPLWEPSEEVKEMLGV